MKALWLALILAPGPAAAQVLQFIEGSQVAFSVQVRKMLANEDVLGENKSVSGVLELGEDGARSVRALIKVDARKFKTGNPARDRDLGASLKAEEFPEIVFELHSLENIDPFHSEKKGTSLSACGTLTIAGKSHSFEMPVLLRRQNGRWRIKGWTKASFKALGIVPPQGAFIPEAEDEFTISADLIAGEVIIAKPR